MRYLNKEQAAEILNKGGIVAVPTETVYGLAAIATSKNAIAKVFDAKHRPKDNPLICHFTSAEQVLSLGILLPPYVVKLMERFSPGPLSYLLELPKNSALKAATCGKDSIIVRIPDHPILLDLIKLVGQPLAAPSANTSGKVSTTNAQMVAADLGSAIDGIIDGGPSRVGLESTIIDCRAKRSLSILRPGVIGKAELEEVLAPYMIEIFDSSVEANTVVPGSKYAHYAPNTPIFWVDDIQKVASEQEAALLLTEQQLEVLNTHMSGVELQKQNIILLGNEEDWNQIASHLYAKMKELDNMKIRKGYIMRRDWSFSSVGMAIENRLKRAVQDPES